MVQWQRQFENFVKSYEDRLQSCSAPQTGAYLMSQIINHFQVSLLRFCQEFDSRKPYNDALPSTLHCSGQFLTSIFFSNTDDTASSPSTLTISVRVSELQINWEQNTILCYSMIFIQITDIFHYLVVRVRTFASFKKFTPYFASSIYKGSVKTPA